MEIRNDTADVLAQLIADQSDRNSDDRVQLSGEVLGTDSDGTVWVHIFGGEERTPVTSTNVVVRKGDVVYVMIGDGRADILGNVSRPSTDDTTAIMVDRRVDVVSERVHTIETDYVVAEDIEATTAYIEHLTANDVTAEEIVADHAEVGSLDVNYAQIDLANVSNAWIDNGLIRDAAIGDAQILGVSANKLTAGTIDASNINVSNLRADTLIVNKLNGQPVFGGYVAVNSNGSGYHEKNPAQQGWYEISNGQMVLSQDTEVDESKAYYSTSQSVALYDQSYIDGVESALNSRIDGAIETFSGSVVPTKQNYPYTEWYDTTTVPVTDNRAEHVGDLYYVLNENLDEDGWCYRFYYDNTTNDYDWVLIKDSDVTSALGRISDLETFETNTSSWIEETDNGLETIRTNHTSLSGTVDKTVKESVQLWFTKANTTAPSKPTSQVTNNSQSGSNSYNKWNLAVPVYSATYPYYFFCWQFKLVDGTYAWSDVVYDQATSEAEERGRTGVSLANANIKSSVQLWFSKANTTNPDKPTAQVTSTSTSGNAWRLVVPTYSSSYPYYYYCYQQQKGDGTYQWTDVVYDEATSTSMKKAQAALPSSTFTTFETTTFKNVKDTVDEHSTTFATYSEMTATDTSGNTVTGITNIVNSVNSSTNSNSSKISSLESTTTSQGNRLTSAESAIQQNANDITFRATKTEAYQLSQPNLTPWFSSDVSDYTSSSAATTDHFWYSGNRANLGSITDMGDGWARIVMDNSSGGSAKRYDYAGAAAVGVECGKDYTFLFEFRNNASTTPSSGTTQVYVVQQGSPVSVQFWGGTIKKNLEGNGTGTNTSLAKSPDAADFPAGTSGVYVKRFVKTSEASDSSYYARSGFKGLCTLVAYVAAGAKFDCEMRFSVYEGEYTGPYKPYSGTQLYASQAELKVANDAIDARVEKNGVIAAINVSPETGVTIDADRVNIDGAAIFTSGRLSEASVNQLSQQNISPFFSVSKGDVYNATTNPSGYWSRIATNAQFTTYDMQQTHNGTGGWAHFAGNATSNPLVRFEPVVMALKPSTTYTFLVEWDGTFSNSGNVNLQLVSATAQSDAIDPFATAKNVLFKGTGAATSPQYVTVSTRADMSTATVLGRSCLQVYGTGAFDCYVRISLYEGEYKGAYKPYVFDSDAGKRDWYAECTTAAATLAKVATITPETSGFSLVAGQTVKVKFTNTNSADMSTVTLNVNGTGDKQIRFLNNGSLGVLPAVGYLRGGTIITFTYDGTYWVADFSYNTNDVDRKRHNNAIKAAENIAQYKICGGTSAGYNAIAASATFDITYPLLYLAAGNLSGQTYALASGSTNTSFYEALPSVTFTNTATIESGAANKMLYLKGTISGNTFTVAATNFLTTGVPDGATDPTTFYIPLGVMTSATAGYFTSSKDLYAYIDGKFRQVNPTDIVASQKVYYRSKVSGTVPKPTAWITETGNKYNDTVSVGNAGWSTKVTPIAANKNDGTTKYLYLYTCEQRKRLDGTIECTTVTLDENTTVIDGGNIITNSITANKIQANSLTLGYINQNDAETAAALLNSNVQVGGRNLLLKTSQGWSDWVTPTANANNQSLLEWRTSDASMLANGATLTFSCDVEFSGVTASSSGTFRARCQGAAVGSTNTWSIGPCAQTYDLSTAPADGVYHYEKTVTLTADYTDRDYYLCKPRMDYWASGKWRMRRLKLEVGNKATDWSPAPEDQTAYVDAVQVGGRNYIFDSAGVNASCLGSADGSRKEYQTVNVGQSYMNIPHGTQVTISFDLYLVVKTANPRLQVYNTNNKCPKSISTNPNGSGSGPNVIIDFVAAVGTTIDQRISATCYVNDRQSPTLDYNVLEFYTNYGSNNFYSISNLKMEIGNKPTDWTPAPEDQQAYVAATAESITATIDTEVGTLTSSISGVSNSLATLGTKVDNLLTKATELEKKTQWVKWDDTEGMIFGENGTAFNTRLKAENMTFNYGNQTMMTLSATGGVDAPKVRTQRLELGSDWAITISGDMFAIDYIGS